MNQLLSIDALRALQSVIDTGSMTRAAQQLNLSQSAVSWKIKRLEEQLGRTLVDRQGMTLTATADGEALLLHGRQILQAHDRALAHFSPSLLQGKVRFGATEQMSLPQLAALLAAFTHQHPQVDVELVIEQSQQPFNHLAVQTRLALAVLDHRGADDRPGLLIAERGANAAGMAEQGIAGQGAELLALQ